VNASECVAMDRFLLAVRRRLWSIRLAEAGHRMLWYSGIALLALAGIHRLIAAVTMALVLAVVGLLAFVLLFRVVRQRPSHRQCAVHADRVFNGYALMTTAVECRNTSENADSFAVKTVLRQANDAAASWSPEISRRLRRTPTSTTVLAIIPLFVALVLLSLPGARFNAEADRSTADSARLPATDKDTSPHPGTDDVAKLRRIIADETTTNAHPSDGQPSTTDIFPAQHNETESAPEISNLAEPAGGTAGIASLAGNDDSLPGDAIARSTDSLNSRPAESSFQSSERVELQRTGPTLSTGTGSNTYSGDGQRREVRLPELVRAAAAPDSLAQSTVLSRAQAAYARRYLEQSGKSND